MFFGGIIIDYIEQLEELINDGEDLYSKRYSDSIGYNYVDSQMFKSWQLRSLNILKHINENSEYYAHFSSQVSNSKPHDVECGLGILKGLKKDIEDEIPIFQENITVKYSESSFDKIKNVSDQFFSIVRHLENRKKGKLKNKSYDPLLIEDEMDVQYLFKALLMLNFNNIQDEESTPSTGSINSRIDFVLPEDKIGIEIKMASSTLKNDKLTEQLNDDIIKYKEHPNCKTLVFFVYNPGNHIINSNGFEKDYTKNIDGLDIITFIRP